MAFQKPDQKEPTKKPCWPSHTHPYTAHGYRFRCPLKLKLSPWQQRREAAATSGDKAR